jgi:hypothetical protein
MDPDLGHHIDTRVAPEARQQIYYFVGDPMSTADLKRVRIRDSEMVYVLADETAVDQEKEDGHSIVRCLSVIKHNPNLKMCLMLLRPESKYQAINAGIPMEWCFSQNEIMGNMLAACCHCPGLITFVANLMDSSNVPEEQVGAEEWRKAYVQSSNNAIYCSKIPAKYEGCTWAECSYLFFIDTGAMVIARLSGGKVALNAAVNMLDIVKGGEICFVIADEQKDMDSDDEGPSLLEAYNEQREQAAGHRYGVPGAGITSNGAVKQHNPHFHMDTTLHEVPTVINGGLKEEKKHGTTVATERPRRTHVRNIRNLHAHVERKALREQIGEEAFEATQQALAEKLVETGGHTVVMSSSPDHTNWDLVGCLLRQLRRVRYAWLRKKVVVMTPAVPPNWVTEAFPDVAFLVGLATCVMDLEDINLCTAEAIVILSGEDPVRQESHLQDHNVLLAANTLDLILNDTDHKVFWLAEIHHSTSAALFPSVRLRPALKTQAPEKASITPKGVSNEWENSLRLNTRFASGQVFCLSFVGAMMGREYYVPSTIEVLEALVMPTMRDQCCSVWLVPMPQHLVGKTFAELFEEFVWVKQKAAAKKETFSSHRSTSSLDQGRNGGVSRQRNGADEPNGEGNQNGKNGSVKGIMDGGKNEDDAPAMPMGIYRTIFPEATCGPARGMGYVIARPSPEQLLLAEDSIFVMASIPWASRRLPHSDESPKEAEELRELNELAQQAQVDPFHEPLDDSEGLAACDEFGDGEDPDGDRDQPSQPVVTGAATQNGDCTRDKDEFKI